MVPSRAEEMRSFALQLADLARPIALRYFRTALIIARKADGSAVTVADLEIETELRRRIAERFPDHGIIGEETGGTRGRHYTWILDPIDGTQSFISGSPLFGLLIGLLHDERPILGLIDIPATEERWVGDGARTLFNGSEAHVSRCTSLAEARLYTTSLDVPAPNQRKSLDRLCNKVPFACYDGNCYAYGLLASGHCDLVVDFGLEPSDYMPLVTVITGSGGSITDWYGRPLGLDSDGRVIAAASQKLLEEAIEILNQPA
jgi:myo-inositol-1(or 4)-monophosphatase